MKTERVRVFIKYSSTILKQFKIYFSELGYTHQSNRVIINEKIRGGTLELRLRKCEAGPQGTFNKHVDQNSKERLKKEQLIVKLPA